MPLRVDVTDNSYAQRVYDELRAREEGLQPNDPAAGQQQEEVGVPADGLLTRTLQDICRKDGAESASRLKDLYVVKTVKLELDHSDEVDGGAATSKMDDDWVDIDYVPDVLKGLEKKEESTDQVAQRAMAKLEKVTVGQILNEYKDLVSGLNDKEARAKLLKEAYKGEGDTVKGTITAAIKAQEKLRDELWALSWKLRDNGNENAASGIETYAIRASSCAQALKELIVRIVKDGEGAIQEQGIANKNVVDALTKEMLTDKERMERKTTEKAVRLIDERLTGLEAAYAKLVGKTGELVSAKELDCFEAYLAKAKMDLADARSGIELRDVKTGEKQTLGKLDESLMDALEARVDRMAADIARLRTDALDNSIKALYNEFPFDLLDSPIFSDAHIDKNIDRYLSKVHIEDSDDEAIEHIAQDKAGARRFRADLAELKVALDQCRKSGNDAQARHENAERARQVAARISLAEYGTGVDACIKCSALSLEEQDRISKRLKFVNISGYGGHDIDILPTLIDRFENMVEMANDVNRYPVDGKLLARVLDGTCGLATAVAAGAWGADVHLLEPGVDDRNLVGCRELGKGACNRVDLCIYRQADGTTVRRVFKPELPARFAWSKSISQDPDFGNRDHLQQVALTNVAAHTIAEKLGVGHSMVGAHLGVHDGQFGLMMDEAEGVTGNRLKALFSKPPKNPEKVMVGKKSLKELMDILSANGEDARKLVGNLRHAFSDLDWIDHIIGSSDRHDSNFMISVGEDLSVRVTGIDNDQCFLVGTGVKCAYPRAISQDTYDKLEALARDLDGKEPEAVRDILSDKLAVDGRRVHDLTDEQLDAMANRIKEAYNAASSLDCEKIPAGGDWLNMDKLNEQAEAQRDLASTACDLFAHYVVRDGMLSLPLNSGAGPLANLDSSWENRRKVGVLLDILRNPEEVVRMVQSAKNGDPAVSEAEMKAFFSLVTKNPGVVLGHFKGGDWASTESTESALVELCRADKGKLIGSIGSVGLSADDSFVLRFLPQCFRLDKKRLGGYEGHFAKALAAVKGRNPPLSKQKLALLGDGGALELAPFIHELLVEFKAKKRDDADGGLIAEALMSELEKTDGDLNEAEIGRLRRLVVNKLNVTPSEVLKPKEAKKLSVDQLARFRKACAITPAGKDYYAQVKAKYEELKS